MREQIGNLIDLLRSNDNENARKEFNKILTSKVESEVAQRKPSASAKFNGSENA